MSTATATAPTTTMLSPPPPSSDSIIAIAAAHSTYTPPIPEITNFKNRLQEYTQRVSIPFPQYATEKANGSLNPPQFRSSVTVGGETYTSLNTFLNKKAAEQDAAKLALEELNKKIKDNIPKETPISGFPPNVQDKMFCKSILHEFATKMNIEMPNYKTYKLEGNVILFCTQVNFNGVQYVGAPGVNRKESEQLAARSAILSILGDSKLGLQLSKVIKSKAKLFSVVHEDIHAPKEPVPSVEPTVGVALETCAMTGYGQDSGQTGGATGNVVAAALPNKGEDQVGNVSGTGNVPRHEFRKPGAEIVSPAAPLPIAFVPSLGEQTPLTASAKRRKNRKKNKAAKKAKMETEAQASETLLNQGMP